MLFLLLGDREEEVAVLGNLSLVYPGLANKRALFGRLLIAPGVAGRRSGQAANIANLNWVTGRAEERADGRPEHHPWSELYRIRSASRAVNGSQALIRL